MTEVKNVKYQYFSSQLQDSLHYALREGLEMVLKVRPSTILSPKLKAVINAGYIQLEHL